MSIEKGEVKLQKILRNLKNLGCRNARLATIVNDSFAAGAKLFTFFKNVIDSCTDYFDKKAA